MATHWQVRRSPTVPGGLAHLGGLLPRRAAGAEPHYVVLFLLDTAAFVAVIIAWFVILFTGRYPRDWSTSWRACCAGTTRMVAYALKSRSPTGTPGPHPTDRPASSLGQRRRPLEQIITAAPGRCIEHDLAPPSLLRRGRWARRTSAAVAWSLSSEKFAGLE